MSLATNAIAYLGGTGTASSFANELGWTSTHESITFAVNEALKWYGDGTAVAEAAATDTLKIDALLQYATWKQVVAVLGTAIDYSADGESFKNNQMLDAAEKQEQAAFIKSMNYLPDYKVRVGNA